MTHNSGTKKIPHGGGYDSPRIEVTSVTSEQGFAESWNDGSIGAGEENENDMGNL